MWKHKRTQTFRAMPSKMATLRSHHTWFQIILKDIVTKIVWHCHKAGHIVPRNRWKTQVQSHTGIDSWFWHRCQKSKSEKKDSLFNKLLADMVSHLWKNETKSLRYVLSMCVSDCPCMHMCVLVSMCPHAREGQMAASRVVSSEAPFPCFVRLLISLEPMAHWLC